jgi:anaerobic magnesium-protoporphyrin IX monomethyl ester cyclase
VADKMTNILFVNIPATSLNGIEQFATSKNIDRLPIVMPLGILYLSASAKFNCKNQNNFQLLDYCADYDKIKNYADNPKKFFIDLAIEKVTVQPEIISITLNFACMYDTFLFCVNELKRLFPNSCIIVGGIQASNTVNHLIKICNIDYVMCGEGEIAFPQCIDQYQSGISLNEIKGVYSRDKIPDKKIITTDFIENLDMIPYPDWDILDMDIYSKTKTGWTHETDVNTMVASVITSRGCIFHCTFCSAHTIHGRKMRGRSIENVISEIKELNKKYGINGFTFIDDLITYDKKRMIDLMVSLKKLDIENLKIEFPNALSINTTDSDTIDLMERSGVSTIILALESGSSYTQKYIIKKNVNFDKTNIITNYIRKNHPNIDLRCNILFGFPHETKQLMQESLDFVKTLPLDWVRFFAAVPLPGSEMYQQFIEMGAIQDSPENWERVHFGFGSRAFDTPEISAEELNEFIYQANLDLNFKNNYNVRTGNISRALHHFKEIVKIYDFQIICWYSILNCYTKLNDAEGVKITETKIDQLLKSDERAIEMYEKYQQYIS